MKVRSLFTACFIAPSVLLPSVASGQLPDEEEVQSPAAPPAPAAASPPAGTFIAALDHRFEGALRVGVMLPGDVSPSNWLYHDTRAAPTFSLDLGWALHSFFVIGAYLQATPLTIDRGTQTDYASTARGAFASGGFTGKARFTVSDTVVLRVGFTLGRNAVSFSGKTPAGSDFSATGGGLNIGAVGDLVYRASPKVGVSAQLGFLSQVSGTAEVSGPPTSITGGSSREFAFKPIFFITVGPELFL